MQICSEMMQVDEKQSARLSRLYSALEIATVLVTEGIPVQQFRAYVESIISNPTLEAFCKFVDSCGHNSAVSFTLPILLKVLPIPGQTESDHNVDVALQLIIENKFENLNLTLANWLMQGPLDNIEQHKAIGYVEKRLSAALGPQIDNHLGMLLFQSFLDLTHLYLNISPLKLVDLLLGRFVPPEAALLYRLFFVSCAKALIDAFVTEVVSSFRAGNARQTPDVIEVQSYVVGLLQPRPLSKLLESCALSNSSDDLSCLCDNFQIYLLRRLSSCGTDMGAAKRILLWQRPVPPFSAEMLLKPSFDVVLHPPDENMHAFGLVPGFGAVFQAFRFASSGDAEQIAQARSILEGAHAQFKLPLHDPKALQLVFALGYAHAVIHSRFDLPEQVRNRITFVGILEDSQHFQNLSVPLRQFLAALASLHDTIHLRDCWLHESAIGLSGLSRQHLLELLVLVCVLALIHVDNPFFEIVRVILNDPNALAQAYVPGMIEGCIYDLGDANLAAPAHVDSFQIERTHIDLLLSIRCPRCNKPFGGFDGCFSVTCSCGCVFCGWCNKDCGRDAHACAANCGILLNNK